MKKRLIASVLLSSLIITGCGDKEDATEGVQKVAIVQGMKTISLFKTQLATYYTEHQKCNSNAISSGDRALTKIHYVQDVISNDQCQVVLTFKNDPTIPDLSGKQIILTLLPTNHTHNWQCTSTVTRKDLLPNDCI
ncbi:pilin [Entomomonas asaccharolytica]|uniref:Pilin n=1 Tax=Entomomonas asaccharolytica TaxID=2785331 RepID=A0A974RVY3_9GAMM|nr:pilin [Entomomonas asaccharolytica]QQP84517.1 pilin [Entomomonas asaccharolytica]